MNFWQRISRRLFSLQEGDATRVIFYYNGEEPTYLDDAYVTVYKNGMVEVHHRNEHVSTHMQNIEILWKGMSANATGQARALTLVKAETSQDSRPF